MTHANHRRGSRESLEGDYVVLVRGDKIKSHPDLAQKAIEILAKHNPVGVVKRRTGKPLRYMRNWKEGMSLEDLVNNTEPGNYIHGTYDNTKDIEGLVSDFTKADIGFSIVISGVFENTANACKKAGITLHTVNLSMETIGRTERLPEDKILELITMCGHSLVSEHLCRHLIDRVRKGKMTSEQAGLEIGKQCVCNFFNPVRATKIIEECIDRQR